MLAACTPACAPTRPPEPRTRLTLAIAATSPTRQPCRPTHVDRLPRRHKRVARRIRRQPPVRFPTSVAAGHRHTPPLSYAARHKLPRAAFGMTAGDLRAEWSDR
jgi:hypothetical protein